MSSGKGPIIFLRLLQLVTTQLRNPCFLSRREGVLIGGDEAGLCSRGVCCVFTLLVDDVSAIVVNISRSKKVALIRMMLAFGWYELRLLLCGTPVATISCHRGTSLDVTGGGCRRRRRHPSWKEETKCRLRLGRLETTEILQEDHGNVRADGRMNVSSSLDGGYVSVGQRTSCAHILCQ